MSRLASKPTHGSAVLGAVGPVPMLACDHLRAARLLIVDQAAFVSDAEAEDRNGQPCRFDSPDAVAFDVIGAIRRTGPSLVILCDCLMFMRRVIGRYPGSVGEWCDDPKVSHQGVLDAMERAADLAEDAGA